MIPTRWHLHYFRGRFWGYLPRRGDCHILQRWDEL